MNNNSESTRRHHLPVNMIAVLTAMLAVIAIATSAFADENNPVAGSETPAKDSAASVAAFKIVYNVLMSPRCMNCHPAGNVPLQGDDSHLHTMFPKRGKDGKGLYAMKCANCHQPENTPGLHTPPGNPEWHLPPANMKMVFEGKTAHQLAMQIMDYNQNGHKNKEQLLEHAKDTLVKAGWNMGEGRTPPPISYDAFVKVWNTWIETGGYAPPEQ